MDYCVAGNQIGTYAPSGGDISTRNIDCVTLDTDTAIVENLTVDGLNIGGDLSRIISATQNQTSSTNPDTTTFSGSVTADQVYTNTVLVDNITAPSGTLTINNNTTSTGTLTTTGAISVSNSTATSSTQLASFLEPNLTGGTTSIVLGKNTSSNNAVVIQHSFTSTGSTSNYAQIALANQSGPQIYSTYTNIPNQLQVGGVIAIPRQIGTLTTLTGTGAVAFPFSFTTTPNVNRIVFNVVDMVGNGAANSVGFLQYGSNGSYVAASGGVYDGITYGNNGGATLVWGNTGIPLWNNTSGLNNTFKISGCVEFTLAGSETGFQRWVVKGMMGSPTSPYYYVYFQGTVKCVTGFPSITNLRLSMQAASALTGGFCNIMYY